MFVGARLFVLGRGHAEWGVRAGREPGEDIKKYALLRRHSSKSNDETDGRDIVVGYVLSGFIPRTVLAALGGNLGWECA